MNADRVNTISILLQSLRVTFTERLKIIEDILDSQVNDAVTENVSNFSDQIEALEARIRQLESDKKDAVWASPPIGLEIKTTPEPKSVTVPSSLPPMQVVKVSKVEEEEEVEVEEEVEEEDDAGTVSLKAFTVRGRDGQDRDYYRDPDNLVYALDADGELIDDPIGRWDEARQKILKLAV